MEVVVVVGMNSSQDLAKVISSMAKVELTFGSGAVFKIKVRLTNTSCKGDCSGSNFNLKIRDGNNYQLRIFHMRNFLHYFLYN